MWSNCWSQFHKAACTLKYSVQFSSTDPTLDYLPRIVVPLEFCKGTCSQSSSPIPWLNLPLLTRQILIKENVCIYQWHSSWISAESNWDEWVGILNPIRNGDLNPRYIYLNKQFAILPKLSYIDFATLFKKYIVASHLTWGSVITVAVGHTNGGLGDCGLPTMQGALHLYVLPPP